MQRFNFALALIGGFNLLGWVGASLYLPAQQPSPIQLQQQQQQAPPAVAPVPAAVRPASIPSPDGPPEATYKPDPAMLALASGGSPWSVSAANVHIARSLEAVRLEAVKRGVDPDEAAKVFLRDEVKHWRFVSWHAVATNPSLRVWQRLTRWWLAQLSTATVYVAPSQIPGSHDLLWQLDVRDYQWNAHSWRAVALREPYTRAVQSDHDFSGVDIHQIDLLHKYIGESRVKVVERLLENGQRSDVVTYPAIGVVRADWLFRDTIETDRSPSYYDLLYSRARFPAQAVARVETYTERQPYIVRQQVYDARHGGYVWTDVTHYREVTHTRQVEATDTNKAAVDFPRNRDDWEEFWGVAAIRKFAAKSKFDLRFGAIVPGSRDDPRGGSIVARNNRVIAIWANGAMETIDVRRTARGADFIEQPVEVSLDELDGANGEFLAPLPNGGQATLLIAGNKRVEFATGRFVQPKFADTRNPDVRTPQCLVCHATFGGVITPRNLFAEYLKEGVELKIADRITRNKVRAFMLGWEHRVKGLQEPYFHLIRLATADSITGKPLAPADVVREFLAFRDWYDDPVEVRQAAWEYGVSGVEFKGIAGRNTRGRAGALARGIAIPREVWERDVYLGLLAGQHRRTR